MYRRNATYRDIRPCKNHFVSGLSGTYNLLLMHLCYRLLEQVQIILNTIRPSRHNPNIPLHAMVEINFDFNKTPLAPPGIKVIVH